MLFLRPDFIGAFFFVRVFAKTIFRGVIMEQKKKSVGEVLRKRMGAKRLAFMAIFVALSYVMTLVPPIPMPFFGASFLSLEFSNVFVLLISFLLGPVEGIIVCLLKECLCLLTTKTNGAGELANFITGSAYLLLPSILYQFRRNIKTVVWTLIASCFVATGAALLANRFIVFPYFAELGGGLIFGMSVREAFEKFFFALILFNLIKTVSVSLLTVLLYKRLSNFLKKLKI